MLCKLARRGCVFHIRFYEILMKLVYVSCLFVFQVRLCISALLCGNCVHQLARNTIAIASCLNRKFYQRETNIPLDHLPYCVHTNFLRINLTGFILICFSLRGSCVCKSFRFTLSTLSKGIIRMIKDET